MKPINFLVFGTILVLVFLMASLYYHESAHVQINKYFGAESEMNFSLLGGTTKLTTEFETVELRNNAFLLHGLNEVVSYPLIPMFIMLGIINIFGFIYLGEKIGGKE